MLNVEQLCYLRMHAYYAMNIPLSPLRVTDLKIVQRFGI